MRLYQILLLLLFIFVWAPSGLSAPDPIEVEERKQEAPLLIDGEVMEDILLEGFDKEQTQYRRFSVKIEQLYQNTFPISLEKGQTINVRYHYLPTWGDYVGGGSIQLVKGDQVKLWLEKKDNHLTPILGSYGVEFIIKNGPRIEHIKEPIAHKVSRVWRVSWLKYSSLVVLLFLIIILFLILKASNKNMR